MKILIVGSNSFLARYFHAEMKKAGYSITEFKKTNHSSGIFDYLRVKKILGENHFDCVISFAWITKASSYRISDENNDFRDATLNLAVESKRNSVSHFIGIGSAAEYGHSNLNCHSLKSPLVAHDAYSTAKIETFQELSRLYGNDNHTWARIFQPYGLGQDSARYLPYLLESKLRNTEPKIHNPDYFCDWISVKDIAHALRFIIENRLFGPLDIGTGCGTTNLQMAQIVQGTFDSDAFHYFEVNPGSSRGLVVSPESRLLQSGWTPTRSLKEEVLQMLMGDAL